MLKSYEAIYKNGILHWLDQTPIERNKELRVLVVVEINETQLHSYKILDKRAEKIDLEIDERLQTWLSGDRRKPQGGRLRPFIQGKTVAQRVLEDRGE
jgi:predicted DNA-binding antitoxin AbrB/MazE fold protein